MKADLLEAGGALLIREAVSAVAKVFRPEALAAATRGTDGRQGVSRPTAYRVLGDRLQTVVDAAGHLTDPAISGAKENLDAARGRAERILQSGEDLSHEARRKKFCEVLEGNFTYQFEANGTPTGWLLQAAALSSSPLWRGERPDPDVQDVGREILAARAKHFEYTTQGWADLLREAMATYGRRPKHRFTVEDIVRLMHCLFDGCVLRMFVDPELNDPELSEDERTRRADGAIKAAAEAMFEVAWAFTQPGSLEDPRRPVDRDASSSFELLIDTAKDLYRKELPDTEWERVSENQLVRPEAVAEKLDIPAAAVTVFFPHPGDLADSVLRRLVAPAGRGFAKLPGISPTPIIRAVLLRLNRAAASHPKVIAAAKAASPTQPTDACAFLQELRYAITEALRSPEIDCPDPHETAESLVELALAGKEGWAGAQAVLNLLGLHDQMIKVLHKLNLDQIQIRALEIVQQRGTAADGTSGTEPTLFDVPAPDSALSSSHDSAPIPDRQIDSAIDALEERGLVVKEPDADTEALMTNLGEVVIDFLRESGETPVLRVPRPSYDTSPTPGA